MATYINSEPSMNQTTKPAGAGGLIRKEEWGIDNLFLGSESASNFIVQSETITTELITDTTQDQKGAVVSQLDYDKHWTLSIDVIGDTAHESDINALVGDTEFSYGGEMWKCTGVTYTGTYNDKKKWTITGERWVNFPLSGG